MMRAMAATHDLDAIQVAAQYASGALSPVEVTRACLARIEAWEPRLNAMYRVDRDGALAAAKAAESRWRAKQPLSPLDGVPVTIKESIYTKGDPAPIGTKANDDTPPQAADAPPSARLREAWRRAARRPAAARRRGSLSCRSARDRLLYKCFP